MLVQCSTYIQPLLLLYILNVCYFVAVLGIDFFDEQLVIGQVRQVTAVVQWYLQ